MSSLDPTIVYRAAKLLGFSCDFGLPKQHELVAQIETQMGWKRLDIDKPKSARKKRDKQLLTRYCRKKGIIAGAGMAGAVSNPDAWVYIAQQDGGDNCVKIGVSTNVERRIKSLSTGSPYPLKVIAKINATDLTHAFYMEQAIHRRLRSVRLEGEWFSADAVNEFSKVVKLK